MSGSDTCSSWSAGRPAHGIEDYNQAIHNLAKRTQWQQALELLPQLEDHRLKASVVTYNTAIAACVRGAQWKIAISFLHHLQNQRLANVITFSTALSSLDAASLWAHAIVLLASMEGFGVRRNSITYNAAISACANSEGESWAAALCLLHTLEQGNTETSIIPYNSATSACARGRWDLALALVAGPGFRNLQTDVVTRNALISVLEGSGWQESLRPFSELFQASLQPTTVTFNSLLKVSATSTEWQRALLLLPEMELRELTNAVSFTTALTASARGLQWKTSLILLGEIRRQAPSVFAYNAALSACEGHGLWEWALQLIAELSTDLEPDMLAYSTGISACARSGAWQWALWLFSVLGRRDAQWSAVTCNSLIRACAKGSVWRRALALLAEARTQHTEVELIAYNACISACEKAAKWEQSLAVLRILEGSPGLQADVISFNAAISACEKCELVGFPAICQSKVADRIGSMVDYSKFDKVAVDSSGSDDAAAVCAPTRPAGQPRSLGRSSSAKQQQEDFAYPTRGQGIVSFDIRDEACRRHGYLHGDVVITENGRVSTAIGVYDDMLWFHVEGSDGAGIWVNEALKKIGRTTVRLGASKEAPTLASEWLNLDFLYTAGVTVSSAEVVPFDIRDEICMSVGGFKHGQVLEVPGIRKPVVTIGVRRDRFCMALWFHVKGSPGAGRFEEGVLGKARVKGHQVVREHTMPLAASTASPPARTEKAKDGGESAESQRLLEQLQAERRARQEAEAEVKNLRKKLEKLRASNASLIKSTSNSERQAERKDRMKRDVIASEVEAETKERLSLACRATVLERLMVELVRPKLAELADLRQEQESVQRRLQNNVLDTQRLREALRLEERIEKESAEKTALARQLGSQSQVRKRVQKLPWGLQVPSDEAVWQFENDAQGWTPYSGAVSAHLMDAYIKGTSNVTVSCEGRSYQVDFTLQMQLNLSTMKRRRIRCNLGLPKHWQMSNEEGLKLIRGEPLSDQDSVISGGISVRTRLTTISDAAVMAMQVPFKRHVIKISEAETLEELEGLLNKSLRRHDGTVCQCLHGESAYRLLEAYQVRNPYLWRRFQRFGRTIRDKQLQFGITPEGIQPPVGHALAKLAKRLDVDVDRNERLLFHGTKHFGYAKAIATEGFDNRVAKEGLYGNGTYFAAQTCKSAQYAARRAMTEKVSSHRPGTIIVARVALGDPFYTAGAYDGSRCPPTKSFNHSDSDDSDQEDARDIICDSLIARPGIKRGNLEQSHMEIVTFAPEQAYPEFILRFAEDCTVAAWGVAGEVDRAQRCLAGEALLDLLWDSEGLRGPDSFLWALAAAGISEAEDPGSFGRLSRVLWSMETLGASSRQVCRSMSRRLLQEINGAGLEEIAMVWALVSGDADLSTAAAIQRRTSPSGLIFHRLGISVMGIAGSFAMAGRLPRSFRASLQKALLQTGRAMVMDAPAECEDGLFSKDDMSATVVWDQPDRAVFFKPPGWEVYGAHTSLFAASHFGNWVAEAESHNFGFLHRLDVPSSGLIAFAKTYAAFYDLQFQLHLGRITRDYTCLAHGWLCPSLHQITAKVQAGTTGPGMLLDGQFVVVICLECTSILARAVIQVRLEAHRQYRLTQVLLQLDPLPSSLQPLQMGDTVKGSYRSQKPQSEKLVLVSSCPFSCPNLRVYSGSYEAHLENILARLMGTAGCYALKLAQLPSKGLLPLEVGCVAESVFGESILPHPALELLCLVFKSKRRFGGCESKSLAFCDLRFGPLQCGLVLARFGGVGSHPRESCIGQRQLRDLKERGIRLRSFLAAEAA
ncbi:Pentatricopeptide repeat-containing protein, chloroplastic [Symbiodinium microadriaticum]|uniref:Poly [ADP-ribose] polymerase n=1 Tax=Symbiodinium microadriaticum TaxID=2951 RepID=A0A1Q9D0Z8_SYMMI|nr:Pentatricopeptide repeat-containing protein, chloroplastic [Symbiodinium microadriaticum]